MNLKRISATVLAVAMTAAMLPAAFAADLPDGWTPADGARAEGGLLIAPAPDGDFDAASEIITVDMPQVEVPAPNGGYKTTISINGKALESFDFDYEIPGWGSQLVTWNINELDTVPAGYVPMRAIVQADNGTCFWDKEAYESWFSLDRFQIIANFNDMTVSVDGETVEGAASLLLNGVTYLPVSVFDGLEGYEVVDNSANGVESYDIKTPNGAPIVMLANEIMEAADMGMGMKVSPAELEEIYGEALGFKAEYMTEGVAFMPMMVSPDTLVIGKAAEGKVKDLEECFEAFRKTQEDTFTWYLSHNLPKVQNAKFVISGDWFMFLIGENADEAVAAFESGVAAMEQ